MDLRHDVALTVAISIAVAVTCLLTWGACHWWYGRKLLAAAQRLNKCDKGRLFSQEQTLQARRQIEQLKSELEAHQRSAAQSQAAARQRVAQLEDARRAAERGPERTGSFMPVVAARAFADTQILAE